MELQLSHWTIKRTHVAYISLLSVDLQYDTAKRESEGNISCLHKHQLWLTFWVSAILLNTTSATTVGKCIRMTHACFRNWCQFLFGKSCTKPHEEILCVYSLYNDLTKAQKPITPFVFSVWSRKLFFEFSLLTFSSHLLLSFTLFCTHNVYNFLSSWEVGWILQHIHFSVLWV